MNRRFFREEQVWPIKRQVSIHFIRTYLMIADVAVLPAGVHQYTGSYDIRLEED